MSIIRRNPLSRGIFRPGGRIDPLRPAAQPGWYKRLRQLSKLTGNNLKLK